MKRSFLLFPILFLFHFSFGQINTDSLWAIWQDDSTNDTARLESLNSFIWNSYLFENPDSAFNLAQEHYDFAESNSLEKYMGQALSTQGVSYAIRGDYDKALSYYKNSLIHFEKVNYKKGIASISNNIGVIYYDQGDLQAAIDNYKRSVKMMEELGNITAVSKALSNIGNVYMDKGDFTNAIDYFEKSYSISKKSGNKDGMINALNNIAILYDNILEHERAIEYFKQCYNLIDTNTQNRLQLEASTLNNLGTSYSYLGQDELALDYYEKSLKIKRHLNNPIDVALMLNNIGAIYMDYDSLIQAEKYFDESLAKYKGNEDQVSINSPLNNMAELNYRKGNYQKAISLAKKSLQSATDNQNLSGINSASHILYQSYKAIKNETKALKMLELYQITEDSLMSVENQKEIIGHSFRYEYDKKLVADSLKAMEEKIKTDARLATQKAQLEKERIQRFSLYGGLFVLLVFGVFMYNRYQISQKQKRIIEDQKDQVEEQRSQLSVKNRKITDSIVYAKRIQSAILPPKRMIEEYLGDSFVLYKPKDVVAGDFYWLRKVGDSIFFAAADCTGHGVPGALVSVVCNSALNRSVGEYELTEPGEILNKTRSIVIEEFEKADEEVKDGMDIALCALKGNKLQYAGANNPLWLIRNGDLQVIRANKQPIGRHIRDENFDTHNIEMEKGDSIYVFTDGFADQFGGPKGKKFKIRALQEVVLALKDQSMAEQEVQLLKVFNEWKGEEEQVDDVCILGFRFS